ncbi:hypothetical protein [Sulfurimonas sp. HSL-1716]|uniref:hypothetical protein n=1 Tax=Hydrocurvibacter sulfurireducens TaxID=3131937 RepID=UPI0031F94A30
MKKFLFFLIFTASFLYAGMHNKPLDMSVFDKMSSKEIAYEVATQMAKSAPIQIDRVTKMTRAFAIENHIVVEKMVSVNDPMFKGQWKKNEKTFNKLMFKYDCQIACNNPYTNYIITKKDVIIEQHYVDLSSRPLFDYTIEKEDCLKIR